MHTYIHLALLGQPASLQAIRQAGRHRQAQADWPAVNHETLNPKGSASQAKATTGCKAGEAGDDRRAANPGQAR